MIAISFIGIPSTRNTRRGCVHKAVLVAVWQTGGIGAVRRRWGGQRIVCVCGGGEALAVDQDVPAGDVGVGMSSASDGVSVNAAIGGVSRVVPAPCQLQPRVARRTVVRLLAWLLPRLRLPSWRSCAGVSRQISRV